LTGRRAAVGLRKSHRNIAIAMSLYQKLKALKAGNNDESNGRHIIPIELTQINYPTNSPNILDIGAGYGADIISARAALSRSQKSAKLFAVESFPAAVAHLSTLDVKVIAADIERDPLPFNGSFFDAVVCNQVLEHTKEIFWIASEICRVLKPGGTLILGVPNLGSLHNRILLLAGYQPPAIHVFGPHVRGFTTQGLTDFLEAGGCLKVKRIIGGNFYPFPPAISRPLSRLLPGLSVSSFYVLERVGDGRFLDVLDTSRATLLVDTPYFRGAKTVRN
jgi:SAM-dependent methyltransferase